MQFITIILSLACAIEAKALKSAFTVAQYNTGKPRHSSPAAGIKATYLKYGKPVPAHIEAAASGSKGSVSATPEIYDRSYLCPVSIGTPAQTLMMDFDTGSSDLWVFSTELSSTSQSGHTVYDPSSSTSSELDSGESWSITYGDQSGASGNIYVDKVDIGGVTATSQAVECATSVSASFVSDTSNDGLVGLAFDSINQASPDQVSTFITNVKSSLASPLFAAHLLKGKAGSYDFGFINASKHTGAITYTPVDNSRGFWGFTATGYSIGTGATQSVSLASIADTGTSLVYLPASVLQKYYAKISGATINTSAGGYIFPCSAKPPAFSIVVNGKKVTIPGPYINYAKVSSTYCFGGLQSNAGIGFNIFGDVFLKSQYVIFDVGNTRIGFAKTRTG